MPAMDRPVLVQAAYGARGRYRTVYTMQDRCGTSWITETHRHVTEDLGYDRCRIRIWIDYNSHYITV